MRGLFLLLLLLPIIELWFLIQVGSAIGALSAIALLILAGVVGVGLLRLQSLSTMARVQARLERGEVPSHEVVEGLLLAIAGVLLLLPGFLSDIVALVVILPPLRKVIAHWLMRSGRLQALGMGSRGFGFTTYTFRGGAGQTRRGDFFEGEYTRENEPTDTLLPGENEREGK